MAEIARKKRPGDRTLPAREWNNVLDRINNLENKITGGRQAPGIPGSGVAMQIASIEGDYLRCVRLQRGITVTATVQYVAKPFLLRQSLTNWNGLTFTYTDSQTKTASGAAGPDELWTVIPEYVVGDIIYAARVPNGTGLFTTDPAPVRIDWIDLNPDGRTWAQTDAAP